MTETARAPAVSVLMDVSHGERFLDAALASLAAQTFADFEVVLVAHGTNPPTDAIIAAWQAREPRLRVVRSPKLSLSAAHNRAVDEARAPVLARLDADDLAMPRRLERQLAMLAADPDLGFVGSAASIIDESGRHMSVVRNPTGHAAIEAALADSCPIIHSTLMVRSALMRAAGAYRPGLNISEDYDLYARLAELARGDNSPEELVAYRVHNQSLTSRRALRMAMTNEAVRAARIARMNGQPEPFVRGTPCLRQISRNGGMPRAELRLSVRATARQARFSRRLLTWWLPLRFQGRARDLALALGLRPAYAALFRLAQRLAQFTARG